MQASDVQVSPLLLRDGYIAKARDDWKGGLDVVKIGIVSNSDKEGITSPFGTNLVDIAEIFFRFRDAHCHYRDVVSGAEERSGAE